MCTGVPMPTYMWMPPQRLEKGVRAPGAGVTGRWMLPDVIGEIWTQVSGRTIHALNCLAIFPASWYLYFYPFLPAFLLRYFYSYKLHFVFGKRELVLWFLNIVYVVNYLFKKQNKTKFNCRSVSTHLQFQPLEGLEGRGRKISYWQSGYYYSYN